jgi:RND superfamily putative drug exporter
MATLLHRLGRVMFRRRGVVLAAWFVIAVAAVAAASVFSQPASDTFKIPGTESQRAIDLLSKRFPEAAADGAVARVVFQAPEGQVLTAGPTRVAVERSVAELRSQEGVVDAVDPYRTRLISGDGTIGLAQVQLDAAPADVSEEQRDRLLDAGGPARRAGLRVEVGGDAVQAQFQQSATEVVGVLVAAVVLVITFGSLLAAGMTLLTALVAVGTALAGITAAGAVVELDSTAPVLALMLGLAVAIDYALFIVSRYRQEIDGGRTPEDAAAQALGTAGTAVVFAGATVGVALVGLSVIGIPSLSVMGVAAAVAVLVAVLVALTLLPALLGFAGRRVGAGRPRGHATTTPRPTFGRQWAGIVTRYRWPALLVPLAALAITAVPLADLRLALPDQGSDAPGATTRQAYDLVSQGFGPGANGPLLIVIEDVAAAGGRNALPTVAERLGGINGIAAVQPPQVSTDGSTALLGVVPTTGPSSAETEDLVDRIRDAEGLAGASEVAVTGATALGIDVSATLLDALPVYLAVVLGLALVLLALVFRSVLIPLTAALGFLLTIASTFGAVVAVFQWGWLADLLGVEQTAPIVNFLPIIMVGVLFGLAMDYQMFLVTRMREEHIGGSGPIDAVVRGFAHSARVVTAAAIIMVSVFAGFVLSGEVQIKALGFAFAFGILIDAVLVRMTIIPALMAILGARAWWIPGWLDKLLPDVDVEGSRLSGALPRPEAGEVAGAGGR